MKNKIISIDNIIKII